jgi:large subunit ribosomal protein L19
MKAIKYTKETIMDIGIFDRKFPEFRVGDAVAVAQKIKEGEKERIQMFEGDVIAFRRHGIATTFTVRRIGANNVPVERVFAYYSPLIESIEFVSRGKVRRAKLFYIRDRIGKAARVKKMVIKKDKPVKTQAV